MGITDGLFPRNLPRYNIVKVGSMWHVRDSLMEETLPDMYMFKEDAFQESKKLNSKEPLTRY